MKKILLIFLLGITSLNIQAQNIKELWIAMPDSIIPYLNNSLRTELTDYIDMHIKSEVRNLLNDTTKIDTVLSDNYMSVILSKSSKMELKILDNNTIGVLQTWFGPSAESKLSLYNKNWELIKENINLQPVIELPDSLSNDAVSQLYSLLEPKMIKMKFLPNENSVLVDYSLSLLANDDKTKIKTIIKQRKYKWNGETFK